MAQHSHFGITPTEYKRYVQDYISKLDKMYSNKDKRYNSQFVNEYKNHFLDKEPIPSIDDYYQVMKQVVPNIPVEAINQLLGQMIQKNLRNDIIRRYLILSQGIVQFQTYGWG